MWNVEFSSGAAPMQYHSGLLSFVVVSCCVVLFYLVWSGRLCALLLWAVVVLYLFGLVGYVHCFCELLIFFGLICCVRYFVAVVVFFYCGLLFFFSLICCVCCFVAVVDYLLWSVVVCFCGALFLSLKYLCIILPSLDFFWLDIQLLS